MNAVRGGAHDPIPVISRIAAEARMSELLGVADSFGFECLGDIGPAPPDAPLSYYVEYGPDPREPERRLFIASSASLPQAPKPLQPPKSSKPRKPSISRMIEQAEKATGKPVTSNTLADGTKLDFGKPESAAPENPWFDDLKVTKQ